MKISESSQSVQVFIEIGHRASCRSPHKIVDQKTHDWMLFVRGKDGKDGIHHFIDKVVFHLHHSFENPIRVIREPPFILQESGYGIFLAKIEVFFRLKDGQSKQVYQHDITLPVKGEQPIEFALTEKLTFNNVSEDFIQRVLDGGGTLIDDPFTGASKPRVSGKVQKKIRKHADTVNLTPQSISPELKSCSKEIEKRQWEYSLFGGDPEVPPKRVRSEGTNSPLSKETALKKKPRSDLLKPKKLKNSSKNVTKEVKSDTRHSLPAGNTKPLANKKLKLESEMEAKPNLLHKDMVREAQEDNSLLEKKKPPKKSLETQEEASSDNFESDNDCEKEVMTSSNEEEQKLVALSGLPYYELESIYSKVMSLNPDNNDELMMSYKVYKILQATGKGYDDDGICFDMHQLDLPIILQIKEIVQC